MGEVNGKRHKHVSPTLNIMAKKIFSLPEVTVAFIRDILIWMLWMPQILEGTQLHKKDFDEDELFFNLGGCSSQVE